jgi:hypothetical protein
MRPSETIRVLTLKALVAAVQDLAGDPNNPAMWVRLGSNLEKTKRLIADMEVEKS